MERRVVVTGIGTVNPLGNSAGEYWNALLKGRSGIAAITRFDASQHATRFGGEVKNFSPEGVIDARETRRMDLFTQFALVGTEEAISDAGIDPEKIDLYRAGVVIGTGIGGILSFESEHSKLIAGGPRRVSPYFVPLMIADIAAGHISIKHGFKGPNYTTISACASASHAIGDAVRLIKYGDADVMITGGSEAAVSPMGVAGFASLRALSTRNDEPQRASRPFDLERDGFVIGEGAGILVVEELEHARKRGATIYAEVAGIGFTGDAHHVTAPAPGGEGAVRAMRRAMEDAGVDPQNIGYINAHGTSTPFNDKSETAAIKTTFGDHAYQLNVSSTKSMTGHLLGAAGAIEAIALVLAVKHQVVPPTINYENPDPECDLNYTPNQPQEREVLAGISNTFGFGGHNASIVVKRFD